MSGMEDHSCLSTFTTTSRAWSQPQICQQDITELFETCMHINGKSYWLAERVNKNNGRYVHIVCFDVGKNEFNTLDMPGENKKKTWKLSSTDNSLAVVAATRFGGAPYYSYEVWRLVDNSVNTCWWERILALNPVSANLEFICYSEGRCVFSNYCSKLYDNDSMCSKRVFYIGREVAAIIKEIRGKLPFSFSINGCTKYCGSLTNF